MVDKSKLACQVIGCSRSYYCKGYCRIHYERMRNHGSTDSLIGGRGEGFLRKDGYRILRIKSGHRTYINKLFHVQIVEKVLGKPLPRGAEVHHIDGNKSNNDKRNLIVCPDRSYHQLLHRRQRALESCGNADYLLCTTCGQYADPSNVFYKKTGNWYHYKCPEKVIEQ